MDTAAFCARCGCGFEEKEKIVNSSGELYHQSCFVCAHCFRAFGRDEIFYEFEGRKYCEHDFHVLYAPSCKRCDQFIIGRVIRAVSSAWHPNCFRCDHCGLPLADQGFIRQGEKSLCHACNARHKADQVGQYICYKCKQVIDDSKPLKYRNEPYHAYHFNCGGCGVELTPDAREVRGDLYCVPCYDKMGVPICGACHKPIDMERIVIALGKRWHVEHFVCAKCERPFLGRKHYEKKGLAWCERHYFELFGHCCHVCGQRIVGDVVTALNKSWCVEHFACDFCGMKMTEKSKFYDVDSKPCCKTCYTRFPPEMKKRLKQQYMEKMSNGKGII